MKRDFIGDLEGGELILSDIEITRRGATYRPKKYKEFLEKHNIRSVVHFNPNKLYDIRDISTPKGTKKSFIETDGSVEETNIRVTAENGYYDSRNESKVSGATWVIYEENGDRFLYTLKDVYKNLSPITIKEQSNYLVVLFSITFYYFLHNLLLYKIKKELNKIMYPKYDYIDYREVCNNIPISFPAQHQEIQPGMEYEMEPKPIFEDPNYIPSCKLKDKVAIITGGDSGIGRAVAVLFAKEGADVVIVYYNERKDAMKTKKIVESLGRHCLLIEGDMKDEKFSEYIVCSTLKYLGKIDILVNNCGVQFPQESILDISSEQLKNTFETNIFSFFYLTKAVLPHLKENSSIINTTSITAFDGKKNLIDYSASKGAITVFTKSLALSLADKKIRVNAVAPGPIWTPLIPASFSAEEVEIFGTDVPLKRAGQPFELAPAYLYLACDDSRYVTGQIIHVNGGSIV